MVEVRKDILLNECGDFAIVNGDLAIVDGVDQIRQSWLIHIRTLLGELITNVNDGVPWFQTILDKHSDFTAIEQIFFEKTLQVPGIISVEGVEIKAFDIQARQWEITVECTCEGEEGSSTFSYQGAMPIGTCTGTLSEDLPLTVDGLTVWFDAQDLGNLTYDPTVPSLRLENKAGEGYALAVGNGPELLVDGDMEAGPGAEELVDGDMEAGEGPEELTDGDMEAGPGPEELTDGDMEAGPGSEELTDGNMEAGPGPEELTDGDMEAVGVAAWPAGNSATVTKQTGTPHGGSQCLRVAYNAVSDPFAYQVSITNGVSYHIDGWVRSDGTAIPRINNGTNVLFTGTTSTSWQQVSVDFVGGASTWVQLFAVISSSGYCEFDDLSVKETCPDWTAANSALLTKETTSPHGGSQCLRVAYTSVNNPYAFQSVQTIGRSYTVTGWARGDGGSVYPQVYSGGALLWTGTTSNTWQSFSVDYLAGNAQIRFFAIASASGYAEFDDCSVKETCPDWDPGNSALLTKVSGIAPKYGLYCLQVTYNGVNNPVARQNCMIDGRSYRITGWARGDGTYAPRVKDTSTTLWTGTSSTTWQSFDVTWVNSGGTDIWLYALATGTGYCQFDECSVVETCPDWDSGNSALLTKNPLNAHGGIRSLRVAYNGTNLPYGYQTIISVSRTYTVTGWARGDGTYAPRVNQGSTTLWLGTSSTTWQSFSVVFVAYVTNVRLFSLATAAGWADFDDVSVKETCPDWTAEGPTKPLLTKSTASPHGGAQALRITNQAVTWAGASQTTLVVGKSYHVTGWARGDGTSNPRVGLSAYTWTGTTSSSWQAFDFSVVADSIKGFLYIDGGGIGNWVEFDDVSIKETCPDWTPANNPLTTKQTVSPHSGLQNMRIAYSTTANPRVSQTILVVTKTYLITGWARSDGTQLPRVYNGGALIWTGSNSTSWQYFEIIRTAAATDIRLVMVSSAGYVEFDDVSVTEGGGGFPELTGVSPLNQRRAVYFNNTIANFNRSHLAFFDTKAIRGAVTEFTVFIVFKMSDDSGVANFDYGVVSFRGQNDTGTSEECKYISLIEDGSVPGDPDIIAYQRDASTFTNSKASLTAADPFDPFYAACEFLQSVSPPQNTDFYYNGVAEPGDAVLANRKLDGDGFIGAALGSDRETPEKFAYGYFGELLVYEGELTTEQIATINAYLASKWGF